MFIALGTITFVVITKAKFLNASQKGQVANLKRREMLGTLFADYGCLRSQKLTLPRDVDH